METTYEYIISDGSDGTPSNIDYSVARQQVRDIKFLEQQLQGLLSGDLLTFCKGFTANNSGYDFYFYWRFTEGTGMPIPVLKFIGAVEENIWALRALYVKTGGGHV